MLRDSVERKRRSWLMITSALRRRIEVALQPFDRRQVEMIGRLVEQKYIRLRRQHARKRGAARFTAGEMRRIFPPGEAELFEQIARAACGSSVGRSPAST